MDSKSHRVLSPADMAALLQGAAVLSGGGGGHLIEAEHFISLAMSQKSPPTLIKMCDVPDDAVVASPGLMGSSTEDQPLPSDPPIALAFDVLKRSLATEGRCISAIVPAELGATNVAVALFLSAVHGMPVVDADPTGRAVPEADKSLYAIRSVPIGLVASATPHGEAIVFHNLHSASREEALLRAVCAASNQDLSLVHHAIPMKDARIGLIEGTLSHAVAIGRDYLSAKESNIDVSEKLAKAHGGCVLLRGTVRGSGHERLQGLVAGYAEINIDDSGGEVARVDFKNENMMVRMGSKACATVPEIITVLDSASGDLIFNPIWKVGMRVVIIVLPAPSGYLTPEGLAAFGPTYAGVDSPFQPAEPWVTNTVRL